MKVAIICSKNDEAGVTIHNSLKDMIKSQMGDNSVSLHFIKEEPIYPNNIDKDMDCDIIIFATKHESKAGIPALSVHVQGNFGEAKMGGEAGKLCSAPVAWMKEAVKILEKKGKESHYEIIQEATHHGPYVETPSMFIELGSSAEEWNNPVGGKIIADTIVELLESNIPNCKSAVGIGGMHHASNFKKIMLYSEYGVGHICPKYNLEHLDKDMLQQAIAKSVPKADLIILDWKGLGEHKERIKGLIEKIGINYKKTKEF